MAGAPLMRGQKVIVGLSGGVDSSVAALLLLERGYEVEALFMKNWDERGAGGCIWEADVEDAMRVCEHLGIRLNTVDLTREYWDGVFHTFLREYETGRTPNPDVLCNQEIKFKAFLEHARDIGCDLIATGHYARVHEQDGRHELHKARDAEKDQSYFLCRLSQAQLACTLFPIGNMYKRDVRETARRAGLTTHDKKDSTGICFVGERPFRDFLGQFLPPRPGEIRTPEGEVVGTHEGTQFYTIGQRHGLGIGGMANTDARPWYVVGRDTPNNVLVVAQGRDHPLLYSSALRAADPHWIDAVPDIGAAGLGARIRYRQPDQACVLERRDGDAVDVRFSDAQWAVAPGQYIVFYEGDVCRGGAVIESALA